MPPVMESDQLIYLFNGLEPTSGYTILQPVLQWGLSPAGGGNYWAITNWYVSASGDYFCGSLITVNPGDTLQGVMQLTSVSSNTYSYHSFFTGYPTGCDLQVNNLTEQLTDAYETLEVYNTDDFEYPADTVVKMYDIQLKTANIYPTLMWIPMNIGGYYGQHTDIISNSSNGGEVDIYFHLPYDLSSNMNITACKDEFLIYPNPSTLNLSVEAPQKSEIEILNIEGQIVKKIKIEENNTTLDISDFRSGMYFIKLIKEQEIAIKKFIKE
jgi:hypothetical protein